MEPCTVTMNGDYRCHDEPWDDMDDAEKFCDWAVRLGRCTAYRITSVEREVIYKDEW